MNAKLSNEYSTVKYPLILFIILTLRHSKTAYSGDTQKV